MQTTRHACTVLTAVAMIFAVTACRGNAPAPSPATVTCALGTYRAAAQNICISGNCGDGKIDQDEICDDGNRIAGDGCSPDCSSVEMCGNGVVDQAVGEVCDDGNVVAGDACCGDCRPCPALARPVATEPARDSLPGTQPCSATLAAAPATPEAPALTAAPQTQEAPALTAAPATRDVPALAAAPQTHDVPVLAALPQTREVPVSSIEAPDEPTRRSARRSRSRRSRSRDLERNVELEQKTIMLQEALETERQQHEELQESVLRGRTDELD